MTKQEEENISVLCNDLLSRHPDKEKCKQTAEAVYYSLKKAKLLSENGKLEKTFLNGSFNYHDLVPFANSLDDLYNIKISVGQMWDIFDSDISTMNDVIYQLVKNTNPSITTPKN